MFAVAPVSMLYIIRKVNNAGGENVDKNIKSIRI